MSFNVCIDIGGTFTDCVAAAPDGEAHIFKAPSTPDAFEQGFMAVLALAAEHYGLDLKTFLEQVDSIVHGTTVSTNALVVAKVGRAGFIANEGHPHVLLLREGPRKRSFDWSVDFPEPFVQTLLTREVGGRIDARGREIIPLAEDDVSTAVAHFKKVGVEAIAVSLLWSIVNGEHETPRSRDHPCRVARDPGHARPRAQPDPARVSARDFHGDQRVASSSGERLRGRAE